MLTNYIWGIIEDNITIFSSNSLLTIQKNVDFFIDYKNILFSQPLFYFLFVKIDIFSHPLFYNLLIFSIFLLNITSAYRFFRLFLSQTFEVPLVLSIFFCLTPYFVYQSFSHIGLFSFFLGLEIIINFIKKNYILSTVFLLICALFTPYTAYGVSIYIFLYFVFSSLFIKHQNPIKFISVITLLFISVGILARYYFINFFDITPDISNAMIFSSRPWYNILPPVDNPITGKYSNEIITFLSNSNYWLTKSFFKTEHSSAYLGMFTSILSLISFTLLLKKKDKNHIDFGFLTISLVGLFILICSWMPFFTINNIKIYLPSYILFYFFPMFRVFSRLSILVLLCVFLLTGYLFEYTKSNFNKFFYYFFFSVLSILIFLDFLVPIKVTKVLPIPDVYTYIKNEINPSTNIAIYPSSSVNEAVYYTYYHKHLIINYVDVKKVNESSFMKDITPLLPSTDIALKNKICYVFVFPNENNIEDISHFDNNPIYQKIYSFSNSSTNKNENPLIKIITPNSSVLVYKVTGIYKNCDY